MLQEEIIEIPMNILTYLIPIRRKLFFVYDVVCFRGVVYMYTGIKRICLFEFYKRLWIAILLDIKKKINEFAFNYHMYTYICMYIIAMGLLRW